MSTSYEISPNIKMTQPVYEVVGEASWKSWSKTIGLINHMTRRSLAARYRGSALGFIWSLVNPVLMMLVYTFVFRNIFQLKSPGVPYQVYLMTGLLAWNFFSSAAIHASLSLVTGASLVNKCAFPRIVLPVSAVLANGVNYLVALPLLIVFNLIEGVSPISSLVLLPLVFVLLVIISTGVGTLLSALMPFFADLQHLIEVVFTMWFFLTPVVYDADIVPMHLHFIYRLNPMVGILQFIHTVFLGGPIHYNALGFSVVGSLLILAFGLWIFSRLSVHCTEV